MQLAAYIGRIRNSLIPIEEIVNNKELYNLTLPGVTEAQVQDSFSSRAFPTAASSEPLMRSAKAFMAESAVPNNPANDPKFKVSTPQPDLLYGYNLRSLPTPQRQFLSQGREMIANTSSLVLPFFVIEFKNDAGNLAVATNQCLGGSATCVNIAERLNARLRECKKTEGVRFIDTASFSIAMNSSDARLHISWKANDLKYYTARVRCYQLQEPEQYKRFWNDVRNVIDWGTDQRLCDIRNAIEHLLREGHERAGAKSRTPPPQDSGSERGTKRQVRE